MAVRRDQDLTRSLIWRKKRIEELMIFVDILSNFK